MSGLKLKPSFPGWNIIDEDTGNKVGELMQKDGKFVAHEIVIIRHVLDIDPQFADEEMVVRRLETLITHTMKRGASA